MTGAEDGNPARVPLGLPDGITTCLFDLDGVLTDTAAVHRAAWKATFDPVLADHDQDEFTDDDYARYVDGKPRLDGVRDFLKSRDIDVPEGDEDDGDDQQTVNGIGNKKNHDVLERIKRDGVKVFDGSRRYLEAARDAGLKRIVVSSSANTKDVLDVTGLADLVEGRIDGVTIKQTGMKGKPAPDSFLAGAKLADVPAREAVVFEDATSGVEAGKRGEFGYVVGVNRYGDDHAEDLRENGANTVVSDLGDLLEDDK